MGHSLKGDMHRRLINHKFFRRFNITLIYNLLRKNLVCMDSRHLENDRKAMVNHISIESC